MTRHLSVLAAVAFGGISVLTTVHPQARLLPMAAGGQAPAAAPAVQQPPAPPGGGGGQRGVPGTESGFATFQTQCSVCHGNPAVERAPSPAALREMSPEKIYDALATGVMQTQAQALNDAQKRTVAEFMSGRPLGSARQGDAQNMPNKCASNPALSDPARGASWNGWGVDPRTRGSTATAAWPHARPSASR